VNFFPEKDFESIFYKKVGNRKSIYNPNV